MLAARLWTDNLDLARACRAHPFVVGLESGGLDGAVFRRYVAQDAFYLRAFLRAYAVALARSATLDQARALHELAGGALEELKLHAGYARRLGIELDAVRPLRATAAYTDFLLRSAWHDPPGVALAALTPCMRLYAWLGAELAGSARPGHPYGEWIATYSSPEFAALAGRLEGLLDDAGEDTPAVRDAYRYAMQCELDFFAAALESPA